MLLLRILLYFMVFFFTLESSIMDLKIKICGIKDSVSLESAKKYGATHIGFIFHPNSKRNISIEQAQEISKNIGNLKIIAVFVNPSIKKIREIDNILSPDYIQLHGNETIESIQKIKNITDAKIIKAIAIENTHDLEKTNQFKNICDYILFDTKISDGTSGGSGKNFDWNILQNQNLNFKWILSGGLNINNIEQALTKTQTNFIDLSSGVEISPGVKDQQKIKEFLEFTKSLTHEK